MKCTKCGKELTNNDLVEGYVTLYQCCGEYISKD